MKDGQILSQGAELLFHRAQALLTSYKCHILLTQSSRSKRCSAALWYLLWPSSPHNVASRLADVRRRAQRKSPELHPFQRFMHSCCFSCHSPNICSLWCAQPREEGADWRVLLQRKEGEEEEKEESLMKKKNLFLLVGCSVQLPLPPSVMASESGLI